MTVQGDGVAGEERRGGMHLHDKLGTEKRGRYGDECIE